jgi:hypothetical protein
MLSCYIFNSLHHSISVSIRVEGSIVRNIMTLPVNSYIIGWLIHKVESCEEDIKLDDLRSWHEDDLHYCLGLCCIFVLEVQNHLTSD